jgi:protein-disulfide isomerase
MKNKAIEEQINDNFKLAQALGLLGTPAFIVGNRNGTHIKYVPGAVSIDSLKQTISQVRK